MELLDVSGHDFSFFNIQEAMMTNLQVSTISCTNALILLTSENLLFLDLDQRVECYTREHGLQRSCVAAFLCFSVPGYPSWRLGL